MRGWRRGNFSHSVSCFPAKQRDLWDELSRSDQLFHSNWRPFLIQYKAPRAVQEREKTVSTLIHNAGSYRLIQSVLVSYGPPEITWERREEELKWGTVGVFVAQGGDNFVLAFKKILLLWNHLGIEKLFYVQTGRNHPFTFFSLPQSWGPQPQKIVGLACCRCHGSCLKAQRWKEEVGSLEICIGEIRHIL